MKTKLIIFAVFISLFLLTGCNQSSPSPKNNDKGIPLNVYTTIYPLQDFSEKIGGEFVEVKTIIPPGAEAHSFEPTSKDMVEIIEGDLFIYMGTGIEGFTDSITDAVKNENVDILKASEGIELIEAVEEQGEEDHGEEEEHGDFDPHVWLDPIKSIQLAENIKNSFVMLYPEEKDYFEKNYLELKKDLEGLDLDFKEMVQQSSNKTFVVSHSAYGYWASAYNLKQIGISGLSPTQEPSQKALKEIIDFSKENNISYILFEPNVSNKVADVVRKEIGAEVLTVHNLEALTDEDIKNNDDYFSIMRENISTLQKSLK
ncbi:metal ABC transporter substrate-binding protein [Bacillus sp. AFS040349]|uniref:metal ABC transporter substrate-binding protein n=1 Tax=Bacillus sp. AFS040349 TaxID=2033502 RepID=UPI000BFE80C6|nr:metal ABC transporter substrate-binding protein [Bacillus sp. AFS040349]PGT79601.1 adhesin [Bacillus sp. AFS040349]